MPIGMCNSYGALLHCHDELMLHQKLLIQSSCSHTLFFWQLSRQSVRQFLPKVHSCEHGSTVTHKYTYYSLGFWRTCKANCSVR